MEVTVATFCKNYSFMTTIPTSTPSGPDSVSIDLSVLKLRVYYGGQSNINRAAFETAIRKVVRNSPRIHDLNWAGVTKLDVQYVGCAAVRSCGWTFNQFIDWMKDGHIYIFLAHPVQNISTRQGSWSRDPDGDSKEFWAPWNLAALGDQLSNKLSRRIGFPEALGCGIFTQDKLVVKRILASKGLCIPFFELLRTEAGKLSKDTKRALFRFCLQNFEFPRAAGQKHGWVLKCPFTTHNSGVFYCFNVYQLLACYRRVCLDNKFAGISSFFVEPRVGNRMEMKILLAEDDVSGAIMPPFLVKHHISSQPDFKAFTGKHDLFAFAKRVKQVLRESGDCAFAPILRIDTFETQTLELKVNEVESLEACAYYSGQLQPDGRRAKPTIIGDLEVFRGSFFEHKVIQLIKLALDTYF